MGTVHIVPFFVREKCYNNLVVICAGGRVMPRHARLKSSSGCYHVVVRGNAGASLFFCDKDKVEFLNLLFVSKKQHHYKIFAFCLLDNHVHIVLQETNSKLSKIMQKINSCYAVYLHNKYARAGHVFQGRFSSEPLENKKYLLAAVRYVHNNPVEKQVVNEPKEYYWSSFLVYMNAEHSHQQLIDKHSLYVLLGWECSVDIKDLYQYKQVEELLCPQNKNIELSPVVLKNIWEQTQHRYEDSKQAMINFYMQTYLSVRELAQITGYSKSKIHRLLQ